MNNECHNFRADLSAYVDAALPVARRTAVEAHLNSCADCRQAVAELRKLATGMAVLPSVEVPPRFLADVHRKLRAEPVSWVDVVFRPVWLKVPIEAVAVVVVVVMMGVWMRQGVRKPVMMAKYDQPLATLRDETELSSSGKAKDAAGEAAAQMPSTPATQPADANGLALAKVDATKQTRFLAAAARPAEMEPRPEAVRMDSDALVKKEAAKLPELAVVTAPAPASTAAPVMLGVHAIAADKPVGQPVEAIVVESVDVTPIRARAATVVAALGGRVVDSVQDGAVALGGRAGGVEPKVALPRSFFVEVPTASVAEFKAQLASASVEKQLGDRSRAMGGGAPAPSRPAAKAQAMQERLMEERSELAFKRKEPVPMTRIEIRVVAPAEKK